MKATHPPSGGSGFVPRGKPKNKEGKVEVDERIERGRKPLLRAMRDAPKPNSRMVKRGKRPMKARTNPR